MDYNERIVKTYASILFLTVIALIAIKVLNISYPLTVTTTTKSTELAVVGEGKVDVTPDTAYVDVGIQISNAKSVADAQKTIDSTNNKIVEAMEKLGVKKENIKTTNYSINPDYSYEGGKSRITGYSGNVIISIKTTKINLVSHIIEKAAASGANLVQGARFEVNKPEAYREEARKKAIDSARKQAKKLATDLGIKLGRVINIVESSPQDPYPPLVYMEKMAVNGGGGPSIEPGTQTISSTVTLYFEKR